LIVSLAADDDIRVRRPRRHSPRRERAVRHQAAAAAAVEGAATGEQKVLALVTYIRKNFRDLFSPAVTES